MPTDARHILILGGTLEARLLAEALARDPGFRVTYALFSPTGTVKPPVKCRLHLGSFGGADGLRHFLKTEQVEALIAALHPHAQAMQQRMDMLLPTLTIPTFRLRRALWKPLPGDQWTEFETPRALIEAVAQWVQEKGAERLLCAVGPQAMEQFLPLTDVAAVFARRFDETRGRQDGAITWLDAQPHPSATTETALIQGLRIDAMVTKNSGGARPAKLDAAQRLGLPVFLLRPAQQDGPGFDRWEDMRDAVIEAFSTS